MKGHVLLIEDELAIAKPIRYALQEEGYDVSLAVSGEEGLEKAKKYNPDIVVLDLMLPGLPGEEVCKEIRKYESVSMVPIIILTAKNTDVDKVICQVIGANLYITKPFDIEELLTKINLLLNQPDLSKATHT
jgi:DNA-binding response OmpR family regulator